MKGNAVTNADVLPVALRKLDLPVVAQMRGLVCADPIMMPGGVLYAQGTLTFLGFAGSLQPDGLYHGAYRFQHVGPQYPDTDTFVFSDLPNTVAAAEVATEETSDDGSDT